ncbi:MAG TPA: zf-HC2 domain-containing protein [Solirubrobacteraceae bacterium]
MAPSSPDCTKIREALPEVALGIADGEQRAFALEHIAHCPDCRRELEQLSSLADELIALAPQREPPPGFENRVLDRLDVRHPRRRPARRRLRRLAFAAAVPAVAVATALAISISYSSDLKLAAQYRAALMGAHGKYFQSAHLNTPAGQKAGVVFAYQGSPSWMFYTLDGSYGSGPYQEQIVTRSGTRLTLPAFRLVNGTWGIATPVPVRDIALVKLIPKPGVGTLTATLPVVEQ